MLRRYKGGYISSTMPTTSVNGVSGMYSLPSQVQAVQSNSWPLASVINYQNLITNFSGTKYYISPTGSDSNPGTSENLPLQTYAQFRTLTSANTAAIMCVFLPGTYTLSTILATASGECCFTDEARERIFVCKTPNQTTFEWTANGGRRDCAPFYFRNVNTRFYGGVIKRDNNARTLNYATAFFNGTTLGFVAKIYNVVLAEVNANGNWSLSYNNSAWNANMGVYNCTFAVIEAAAASYAGADTFIGDYCAGNYSVTTATPLFTNYVNAAGTMNPTTYVISGTSGVYTGAYAW